MSIRVIYRLSDAGYKKEKPKYIDNKLCLENASKVFGQENISVICDNCSTKTLVIAEMNTECSKCVKQVSIGHGAGTFNLALDQVINLASFVALYDHPDKYLDPRKGGNPYCEGGAEDTRVYLTESCHWKITNSTTMTFAAKVSTLKRVEPILRKWTSETHPNDFQMFMELRKQGELLVTPIPGYATHGESAWLSPLTDWSKI